MASSKDLFRPSLMVEVRIVLLLYGVGVMNDPPLLDRQDGALALRLGAGDAPHDGRTVAAAGGRVQDPAP